MSVYSPTILLSIRCVTDLPQWGVSNTPPNVLEEMIKICDDNGWIKPSYYQGSYSIITRGMETKLLPILRSAGMQFNGYQYAPFSFECEEGCQ